MTCPLLSTCVYPAAQSSEGRVGVTRSLSHQGSDVTDHPGFCSSGWGGTEEYRGQRTYSPCVPQSQVMLVPVCNACEYAEIVFWKDACICVCVCFVCSSIPCYTGLTAPTTGLRAQTWTVGSRQGVTWLRPLLLSPSLHQHLMVSTTRFLCYCE